jgi:NAD(P)-dependent dehydrogenase (short-subunit alcohol dehydrogenase family)/acyl carrier protein
VRSLELRPATAHRRDHGGLYRLGWAPRPEPIAEGSAGYAVLNVLRSGAGETAYPDLAALRADLSGGGAAPDAIVVPCPADGGAGAAQVHAVTEATLALLREWLADDRFVESRLVVVTHGAVAARPSDEVRDLTGAAVWGLVRTAQSEHPGRLLLLDDPGDSLQAVQAALAGDEPQLAVRDGRLLVPRLGRAEPGESRTRALDPDGTVMITGGTGTLGRLVAGRLVSGHGVRHLLLVNRHGPAGTERIEAELMDLGARGVTIAACDVADERALAATLAAVPAEHPLTAVVHAAGTIDDGTLAGLTPERLHAVLRPKVDGAWNLHRMTADLDLSAFVLFSSIIGVIGAPGQANYAAANAFLDGLAWHRHAAGLPATSLAWGRWAQVSDLSSHLTDADVDRMSRSGVVPLPTESALELFDAALATAEPDLVPALLDPAALRERARAGTLPAVLRGLAGSPTRRTAAGAGTDTDTLETRLAALPAPERHRLLLDLVRAQAAAVLGRGAADGIEPGLAFRNLGFDSLTAVELRNRLSGATGLRLPATTVFDHPTPAALATYLHDRLAPEETAPPVLAELDRLEAALSSDPPVEAREEVAARLRNLLQRLNGSRDEGEDLTRTILSATNEEIFALIDNGPQ